MSEDTVTVPAAWYADLAAAQTELIALKKNFAAKARDPRRRQEIYAQRAKAVQAAILPIKKTE